jgi:hypothetical protein
VVGLPTGNSPRRAQVARRPAVLRRISRLGTPTRARLTVQCVALVVMAASPRSCGTRNCLADHNMWAGPVTSAASGDAAARDIMQHTRHRDVAMVRGYVREGEPFHEGNATRFTGILARRVLRQGTAWYPQTWVEKWLLPASRRQARGLEPTRQAFRSVILDDGTRHYGD